MNDNMSFYLNSVIEQLQQHINILEEQLDNEEDISDDKKDRLSERVAEKNNMIESIYTIEEIKKILINKGANIIYNSQDTDDFIPGMTTFNFEFDSYKFNIEYLSDQNSYYIETNYTFDLPIFNGFYIAGNNELIGCIRDLDF